MFSFGSRREMIAVLGAILTVIALWGAWAYYTPSPLSF